MSIFKSAPTACYIRIPNEPVEKVTFLKTPSFAGSRIDKLNNQA
jgi:hypothetical protein